MAMKIKPISANRILANHKFREKLEGWLGLIRAMWPECPAVIDRDGVALLVDRAKALNFYTRDASVAVT
jgi:hypothetical protein